MNDSLTWAHVGRKSVTGMGQSNDADDNDDDDAKDIYNDRLAKKYRCPRCSYRKSDGFSSKPPQALALALGVCAAFHILNTINHHDEFA